MKKVVFTLSMLALLASCGDDNTTPKKDENPIKPEEPAVVEKKVMTASIGGGTQPNHVYIDLSTGKETPVVRDAWDLGFYCGNDNRVIINNTIKMAVKPLETTNIDEVVTADYTVAVSPNVAASNGWVDSPFGILASNNPGGGTAIAEISENPDLNKVYLVNLGDDVANAAAPETGAVNLSGAPRGWKKIKINRQGDKYILHYANLNETTHKTIEISKNNTHNFVFFNLKDEKIVNNQPEKTKWDISFTGHTLYTGQSMQDAVLYYFADICLTNIHGGAISYQVELESGQQRDTQYENFKLADVDQAQFTAAANQHQLTIGRKWRNTMSRTLKDNAFYVIKDAEGNIFKLKFLAMMNDAGERGHTTFEYQLLK
ncbi:HmuY family protein [Capnocytophaga sp. ARDL2]|uniref:HmuY family protein n=1 Tax=Capnocytophaga sp. ARDL2 TaxID=3238809 RepID=UPI003557AC01